MPLPDCPWCTAPALEIDWVEMGETFCTCTCCGKQCRVTCDGVTKLHPRVTDVSGAVMADP